MKIFELKILLLFPYLPLCSLSRTYVKQNLFGTDSLDLKYVEGRVSGSLATDVLSVSLNQLNGGG